MSDWHGWSRSKGHTGRALHIGPLPGRKQLALYTMDYRDGAVMQVHAYFRSEDEARKALDTLDDLLGPVTAEVGGDGMSDRERWTPIEVWEQTLRGLIRHVASEGGHNNHPAASRALDALLDRIVTLEEQAKAETTLREALIALHRDIEHEWRRALDDADANADDGGHVGLSSFQRAKARGLGDALAYVKEALGHCDHSAALAPPGQEAEAE